MSTLVHANVTQSYGWRNAIRTATLVDAGTTFSSLTTGHSDNYKNLMSNYKLVKMINTKLALKNKSAKTFITLEIGIMISEKRHLTLLRQPPPPPPPPSDHSCCDFLALTFLCARGYNLSGIFFYKIELPKNHNRHYLQDPIKGPNTPSEVIWLSAG